MQHNDDDAYIQLDDVTINEEESEFIHQLYLDLLKKNDRKEVEGLKKAHFYKECLITENEKYCWIMAENLICKTMIDNKFEPSQIFCGKCGNVYVFTKEKMDNCIDQLIEMCKTHYLKINE